MEKLRDTIGMHGYWSELETYVLRIEAHVETDFSLATENCKALLESVAKEICDLQGQEYASDISVNGIMKLAFGCIGIKNDSLQAQVSSALATIGQQIGQLRNVIGSTSHGRTLSEIKARNDVVDDLTRKLLIDTTENIACFLIRSYEAFSSKSHLSKGTHKEKLEYSRCAEFNETWDESFGDFQMGAYSFTASEILFHVDNTAYETEYRNYQSGGE